MTAENSIKNTGLRGVTVASTRICHVDGKTGKLLYRGYRIEELAENASYEETAYLLLHEKLPNSGELEQFRRMLDQNRATAAELTKTLKTRPASAAPMDILQAAVPMLAHHDPNPAEMSTANAARLAGCLIAALPVIVAAWHRIRREKAPIPPDPQLGHAANFLTMLSGRVPDAETIRFMDTCLVLHAEHAFNASTFAARQVASTRAHMFAAAAAAVGSLSGELHGGANARVMQMLQEIDADSSADAYVAHKLAAGEKIMGMGHAVYTSGDPRARILAPMAKAMGEKTGADKWFRLCTAVENAAKKAFREKKGREIFANVDFYSAPLYYTMGIPVDLFTPVFAVARIAGWAAHITEEQHAGAAPKPALYRPSSQYTGDYCGPQECAFVPMEQR